jgi:hypothetical protein
MFVYPLFIVVAVVIAKIAMAVMGTFTMVDFSLISVGSQQMIGFALLLCQQIVGAFFFVIQKRVLNKYIYHLSF